MPQLYQGDCSSPQWQFDSGLHLWHFYDSGSRQTIYHDCIQYVVPPHNSMPGRFAHNAVASAPWNSQYYQPRSTQLSSTQHLSGMKEDFPLRTGSFQRSGSTHWESSESYTLDGSRASEESHEHAKLHSVDTSVSEIANMSLYEIGSSKPLQSATRGMLVPSAQELQYDSRMKKPISVAATGPSQQSGDDLLCKDFKKPKKPRHFFVVGKVFLVLWSEPGGDTTQTIATAKAWTKNSYGELVYTKVRRFVVVKEQERSCMAIPILTYQGQGVAKRGVKKSDHAIIFTGKSAPAAASNEAPGPGEEGMRGHSIRVDADQPDGKLDAMSRIDFSGAQKVQHYYKVKSFGKVNRDSSAALEYQYRAVVSEPSLATVPRGPIQTQRYVRDSLEPDPRLSRPEFKTLYDALIGVKCTPEQANELMRRASAMSNGDNEHFEAARDDESDSVDQRIDYASDT